MKHMSATGAMSSCSSKCCRSRQTDSSSGPQHGSAFPYCIVLYSYRAWGGARWGQRSRSSMCSGRTAWAWALSPPSRRCCCCCC
jgi:hypothetical protein